jgi:UDP-4-amino-4,6-dideoxy-N-acetyl-beta-L-altrosamine N-acetyltransferase
MPPAFLIGTSVHLRALERSDAVTILPWVNDQQVTQHLLIHKPMNLAAEEFFIDAVNRSEHDAVFGICDRASGDLVGVAGLHRIDPKNRQAMFGIFIGQAKHRGKGMGTETTDLVVGYAFDTLNLHRVWLHVYEDNKRAIRVYEKLGFVREGLLRQDSFRRGRYWNTVVMGLLQTEFARRGRKATRPRR